MKKLTTKLAVTALAIMGFVSASLAQFEGTIEFKKMTTTDTTTYIFYVKGNKVRIDEIGSKSKKVSGTDLVDLSAQTMVALNPERKLFMDRKTGAPVAPAGKPEVTNTKASKTLLGVNCKEVVVTSKEEGVTIKYYLGGSKFEFFPKMLRILNRKEQSAMYFLLIKDTGDGFPYMSVQTDASGKETGRLEVFKLEKKTLDASLFEIPKDYKKFENN